MNTTGSTERITVRQIKAEDVDRCGVIAFEAHRDVAARHNVPCEQPSVEFSTGLIRAKLADPNAFGMVAEYANNLVGSVFLNTFSPAPVASVGPLTVSPDAPPGVGRTLMTELLADERASRFASIRLVQSPSHLHSLGLYAKLGFVVREPLVLMQGACPPSKLDSTCTVRSATQEDLSSCARVAERVFGFSRDFELRNAIGQKVATVIDRGGKITGYATGLGFRGHAAALTTVELMMLMAVTPQLPGPGFFVPTRNGELLRWLLDGGLRMEWPAMLMSRGDWEQGSGAFLPSIAF